MFNNGQSVFGPTMGGVPNPQIPHVHPYPTRFHGPIWTTPVFGLPYRSQPYLNAVPGYEAQWLQLQGVGNNPDGLGEPLLCSTTGNTLMDAAFGAVAGYFVAPKHGNTVVWAVAGAGAAMLAGLVGVIGVAGAGLLARSGKKLAVANPRTKGSWVILRGRKHRRRPPRRNPRSRALQRDYDDTSAYCATLSDNQLRHVYEDETARGRRHGAVGATARQFARAARDEMRRRGMATENARHHSYHDIHRGDRVVLLTPHGQERTGTAVMLGPGGWVLNMGGPHGTPGIVNEGNFVRIARKARR